MESTGIDGRGTNIPRVFHIRSMVGTEVVQLIIERRVIDVELVRVDPDQGTFAPSVIKMLSPRKCWNHHSVRVRCSMCSLNFPPLYTSK